MKLSRAFYARDTLVVARELLGTVIVVEGHGGRLAGRITETEAYLGVEDKACHSSRGKTARTAVMFGPPGYLYVYLCYGIHCMVNVVTREEGYAEAVLIRAVDPLEGVPSMFAHCPHKKSSSLTNGPGKWTRAFSITMKDNACDLLSDRIYILNQSKIRDQDIVACPRIGVDYAGEWKDKPFRFYIRDHKCVSRQCRV